MEGAGELTPQKSAKPTSYPSTRYPYMDSAMR